MRTNLVKFLFLGLLLVAVAACEKDNDNNTPGPNQTFNIRGNANGAQEAPNRVTTTATGTITGTYNKETNVLNYTINYTGLSSAPNNMHFHGPADPGVAAGVQVGISGYTAAATGMVSGQANLSEAQEKDLLEGMWYYNIHTPANGAGEIRGQVFVVPQ